MSIRQAFELFINEDNGATFEQAVRDSTSAGFGGSGYSVELFEDGTFRVLWENQIGNLYRSPGLILGVPQLDQEAVNDMQEYGGDADLSFALDDAKAEIRESYAMRRA